MAENNFLQIGKPLIIVVVSLIIGWFGNMEYQKYQSETDLTKPIDKNIVNNTNKTNISRQTENTTNTNNSKTVNPTLYCPTITSASNYEFKRENEILYLSPNFLKTAKFSNGFKLNNLPSERQDLGFMSSPESYERVYRFECEKGSKVGENIDKLHCKSYFFVPELVKNTTDTRGKIIKIDKLYVDTFAFNIEGKNINDSNDLKNLKFNSITCSHNTDFLYHRYQ